MANLLENNNVSLENVTGAENLQSALSSGSHDIVIAPLNLGAKLYIGEKSTYKIEAVITLNNAYIVTQTDNPLDSINDLIGKEIMAFGKAGIPGSLVTKLYNDNEELDLSNIEGNWYDSSADVYGLFKGGSGPGYAVMSEPEISKLIVKDNISVKTLDICSLLNLEVIPQACIFVNPNSDQTKVKEVLELIEANINCLNNDPLAYAEKAITLHNSFNIMGKEVITRCIPLTNIKYLKASEIRSDIENTLTIIGLKKVPGNEFYN